MNNDFFADNVIITPGHQLARDFYLTVHMNDTQHTVNLISESIKLRIPSVDIWMFSFKFNI